MKTLRKYVVNGGIFDGDGRTPAAVGDQVRLYLDTEAHEDFPESILATIQHPVAPLSGNRISYSFEYDEADLLGVVANLIVDDVVNVEVVAAGGVTDHTLLTGRDTADAHPISAITGLDAALAAKQPLDADLTAYAGAADEAAKRALLKAVGSDTTGIAGSPVQILNTVALTQEEYGAIAVPDPQTNYVITDAPELSAETVLALLEGEDLAVAAIKLGDTSAVTLSVGSIGGDGAGRVAAHDGTTMGGVLLMEDTPLPAQHALIRNSALSGAVVRFIKFGEIVVSDEFAEADAIIRIGLDVTLSLAATLNLTNLAINFRVAGQNPGESILWPAPAAPVSTNLTHEWSGVAEIALSSIVSDLAIQDAGGHRVARFPATSGNVTGLSQVGTSDFSEPITSGTGFTLEMGIYITTSDPSLAGGVAGKAKWTYELVGAP